MLRAIFYARFHPERGPTVVHQYPNHSIIGPKDESLLNFSEISSYIIPQYDVCNRSLSVCIDGFRIFGFPISLEDAKYARNRFTFNVCFVLDEDTDDRPWNQIVRKTARFFQRIEKEDGLLQGEELLDGLKWAGEEGYPVRGMGMIHGLLGRILEDLNTYQEACVRLDDVHVLNLRMVPPRPVPPKVEAWDVPFLIRPLPSSEQWTWDLVLQRIQPYVDGIKHVQRIAELADVEIKLVKKAIRELLLHERVVILDIFHFQATYTTTGDFEWFVEDEAMLDECCAYVATDPSKNIFGKSQPSPPAAQRSRVTVIDLYRQLSVGLTLKDFCLGHEVDLCNIDIRRFITFGVLKGFLRRVHKYPLSVESYPGTPKATNGPSLPRSNSIDRDNDRAWKVAALSSGWPTPPVQEPTQEAPNETPAGEGEDAKLRAFLTGKHYMDEICVALHMSEQKVVEKLNSGRFGEVIMICR